jgi:hypothetical protein
MLEKEEPETFDHPRFTSDKPEYLASHRSLAACQRELSRLTTTLTKEVEAIADREGETSTIRRTPERCILQLGPVAMTVAWLRTTVDSVADGRLLVMVWRGTIASRGKFTPERPSTLPVSGSATIEWQDTLAAQATSEEDWVWRGETPVTAGLTSDGLAQLCITKLRAALESVRKAAA